MHQGADLTVAVWNAQRSERVDTAALERFLLKVAREAPPLRASSVGVRLVSDAEMARANVEFRGKSGPTDVLSFPDGADDGEGRPYLGDILIAVPTARRQAKQQSHPLRRELQTLLLHGYLHLLGYDHEADDGLMMRYQRRLERRLWPPRRPRP